VLLSFFGIWCLISESLASSLPWRFPLQDFHILVYLLLLICSLKIPYAAATCSINYSSSAEQASADLSNHR
jgi:hypothetical protein